jgi:hypothetical protein
MRIDPSAQVAAFERLEDTSDQVRTEVAVAVTKQVLDTTEDTMLRLVGSLEPHLGRQVDLRL